MKIILLSLLFWSVLPAPTDIFRNTINPFTSLELQNINRNFKNELQQVPDMSQRKQRNLLFVAAKKGNYGLVKALLKQIELKDSDFKTLVKSKNNRILGLLLLQKPDKVLSLISNKIPKVLLEIPEDNFPKIFENASEELVSGIISQIGKEGNFELLKKMGQIDPVNVLKEIILQNKSAAQIQDYLQNIKNLSKKQKIGILSLLQVEYILDSLNSNLVLELEKGLDENDFIQLKELKEYTMERMCQICLERERVCYFPCQNAEQYGHGACLSCFHQVSSGSNPQCPWCRKPYYPEEYDF